MTAEREWWCDFFGTGAQERQEVLGVFFGQVYSDMSKYFSAEKALIVVNVQFEPRITRDV